MLNTGENMRRSIVRELGYLNRELNDYVSNGNDLLSYFNLTQLKIINYILLHENENVCQKDLELETNLKKASITGCLDSLAERDLIKRVQADDDKRKNYIRLTDKAITYKNEFYQREVDLNNWIEENINKEDLDTFFKVIKKIRKNIDKENNK